MKENNMKLKWISYHVFFDFKKCTTLSNRVSNIKHSVMSNIYL